MFSSDSEHTEPVQTVQVGDMVLQKQSLRSQMYFYATGEELEEMVDSDGLVEWCLLLKHKDKHGKLHEASEIELGTNSSWLNRVAVRYKDGTQKICGVHPRKHDPKLDPLPSNRRILKIGDAASISQVALYQGGWAADPYLRGIEISLSDGGGANAFHAKDEYSVLRGDDSDEDDTALRSLFKWSNYVLTMQAPAGQSIIGFYGHSDFDYGMFVEFGILSAPNDIELPVQVFDMERTVRHH